MHKFVYITVLTLVLYSCAGTSAVVIEPDAEEAAPVESTPAYAFAFDISTYRITADAVFYTRENEIPEVFQVDQRGLTEMQRNAGFRVQIISTSDVRLVEELQREFLKWMDEFVPDYDPETYIQFRQPFYRLHVGNFFSRADAITLNTIIKRKYPDAWVVHDVIDPDAITHPNPPSDTP